MESRLAEPGQKCHMPLGAALKVHHLDIEPEFELLVE